MKLVSAAVNGRLVAVGALKAHTGLNTVHRHAQLCNVCVYCAVQCSLS